MAINMVTFPPRKESIMSKVIKAFHEQVRTVLAEMAEGLLMR